MIQISTCLRNKIQKDLKVIFKAHIECLFTLYRSELDFKDNEIDLYKECIKWYKYIETYINTSHNEFKIDCGRFKGIHPAYIEPNKIIFCVTDYEEESWKDWFIMEKGGEYAP